MFQIKAWRRPGDKPLSEAMLVSLPTHIWVTRPQWVKPIVQEIPQPLITKISLKISYVKFYSNLLWDNELTLSTLFLTEFTEYAEVEFGSIELRF